MYYIEKNNFLEQINKDKYIPHWIFYVNYLNKIISSMNIKFHLAFYYEIFVSKW